ncbi:MAG TPA: DNA replication/repair protein RecF [Thermodesulfobacteriota bacterium]|nr:DNA replication/repair protein RecF [Thermodesulfobacteriota bacterium]
MILRSITLRNFRNYKSETLTFHERFNLISGDNAQGKTNLLEAIHLLCTFRPFKQVKMEELISFGETEGRIKGEIDADSGLNEVHVILTRNGKTVKLNGKIAYNTSRVASRFSVVSFLPLDLELIKGTPQVRRTYVDLLVSNFDPNHAKDLKSYFRAVTQRNALLMRKEQSVEALEVWDEKIGELGGRIVKRRINFIQKLEHEVERNYVFISGLKQEVKILYKPSFKLEGSFEEELKKELISRYRIDKIRGHTSVGPHRDLIIFTINGKDASTFASQGESKTLALSLKASEIKLIRNILRRNPVLLLDDVASELDQNRKNFLFRLLQEFSGQVFVTSTSAQELPDTELRRIFQIKAGRAQVIPPASPRT